MEKRGGCLFQPLWYIRRMDFDDMMNRWLDQNEVKPKEKDIEIDISEEVKQKARQRKRLLEMAPEEQLDLHSFTLEDARTMLDQFIRNCASRGVKKVLVIHGKGLHSENGGILQQEVRKYIEKSPLCGEFGYADKRGGGKGALWVILR